MRLACAADFRQGLEGLPVADAQQVERFAELMTQLRAGGYSGEAAAEMAQRVLAGGAVAPARSRRFAMIYGDGA